jgi:cell division protein FtsZ
VRQLILNGGGALMAIGLSEGPDKAKNAAHQAMNHPLLEIDSISQATGVLVHYTGGSDLTLHEVGDAVEDLRQMLPPECDLILGASTDDMMSGRAQVILIVTGIGGRPVRVMGTEETFVMDEMPSEQRILVQDNLDLPAFLRRRASIG